MELVINNHIIDSDITLILDTIKVQSNNKYLKNIINRNDNISITCPFHNNGNENRPSCCVYNRTDNSKVPYGFFRCFTCGEQGNLWKLVSKCLNITYEDSKIWLTDNFSNTIREKYLNLPKIELHKNYKKQQQYLNEKILDKYSYLHPYQFKRGLTEEIIKKFKIGYNFDTNSITFPVWNEHGQLVGITERNVDYKKFYIPKNMDKPVYLLNFIEKENITEVVVCESQINALTLWSWGIPAIALFGTGSKHQYEILNKSGIRVYHLAFDGDLAGQHGALRFKKAMNKYVLVDVIEIPKDKDVNDLSKEEYLKLPIIN